MANYVGAIDQGTTSTRFIVFDRAGRIVSVAQREHEQVYPQPGWVEHDSNEIWRRTQEVMVAAMAQKNLCPGDLAAIGITNQRETTLLWDRKTGKPITNAIVWQDTRTENFVREFSRHRRGQDRFRAQTGLHWQPISARLRFAGSSKIFPAQARRPRPVKSCSETSTASWSGS